MTRRRRSRAPRPDGKRVGPAAGSVARSEPGPVVPACSATAEVSMTCENASVGPSTPPSAPPVSLPLGLVMDFRRHMERRDALADPLVLLAHPRRLLLDVHVHRDVEFAAAQNQLLNVLARRH